MLKRRSDGQSIIFPAERSKKHEPPGLSGRLLRNSNSSVVVERSAEGLVASTLASILPVHLDKPVQSGQSFVVTAVADCAGGWTELPRTLVGVLLSGIVVPRVKVRIRNSFFRFMRHDRGHSVSAAVAIWTDGLSFASRTAAVGVSNKGILNVGSRDCGMRVPTAIPRAESRSLVHV